MLAYARKSHCRLVALQKHRPFQELDSDFECQIRRLLIVLVLAMQLEEASGIACNTQFLDNYLAYLPQYVEDEIVKLVFTISEKYHENSTLLNIKRIYNIADKFTSMSIIH